MRSSQVIPISASVPNAFSSWAESRKVQNGAVLGWKSCQDYWRDCRILLRREPCCDGGNSQRYGIVASDPVPLDDFRSRRRHLLRVSTGPRSRQRKKAVLAAF